MTVIEANRLTKIYNGHKALDEMSFQIAENTITGLIGRNGAGKTTLLKIIAGFLHHTSGEVSVFAEKPFNSLKASANMIFIDDQMNFPTALTLQEILHAAGNFYANWDSELANRLFDYFSLHPKSRHHQLSKGMTSTFNMIIGLAARCPLTIFDEPTTGMDAAVRKDFYRAVLKDYLAHPRTMIISSHLLNEIEDILEDVLLMKEGKALFHLPIAEMKEYAIGLTGRNEQVVQWTKDREVLHQQQFSNGSSYVVVKNELTQQEQQQLQQAGIEVSPVSSTDLSVYVTSKTQGGIDDVFDRG